MARLGGGRAFCSATVSLALLKQKLSRPASLKQLKDNYYKLAKIYHPDTTNERANHQAFQTLNQAFEELMQEHKTNQQQTKTSKNNAARGYAASAKVKQKANLKRPNAKPRTLGEILCERLHEEPGLVEQVWADIRTRNLVVTESMTSALFKAHSKEGPWSKFAGPGPKIKWKHAEQHRAAISASTHD